MLPVRRPAAWFPQDPCLSPLAAAFTKYHPHAGQKEKVEDAHKLADTASTAENPTVKTPIAPKPDVAMSMEDESQTQIEPSFAIEESKIAYAPAITIADQPSDKNEDHPVSWERNVKLQPEPEAIRTEENKTVEESKAAPTAKENVEKEAAAETSVDVKGSAKSGKDVKEIAAPTSTKREDASDGTKPPHTADSDAAKDEGMLEPQAAGNSEMPEAESFKAEMKPFDRAEETSAEVSKPVQHKAPATEASGPMASTSEVETKAAPVAEEVSAKSEEKKDNILGAVISKDAEGDKKHTTEPSESPSKTVVSMTHTAHTVEKVETVMPATEKCAQEPVTLIHDHKTASALEEAEALKDVAAAREDLPQLSLKLEESSSESTKITVDQSQEGKAAQPSDGHTTTRPPAEAGDTWQHVTEAGTKPEGVNVDDAHRASHEGVEASTTDPTTNTSASVDKPESQTSAGGPEMSLDDLIVEGATASPMALSQPLEEATAAK